MKTGEYLRTYYDEMKVWRTCEDSRLVSRNDEIRYDGKLLKIDKEKVVIAFNKPKNVITSVYDPYNRKIVMDYIQHKKRLVPVGRLDKDSTGLLLLTNDGDLHHYLTHPKNEVIREYDVSIDRVTKL